MSNVILGIILLATVVFLAFLVCVTILSHKGGIFVAGKNALVSGWRGMKSRLVRKDSTSETGNEREYRSTSLFPGYRARPRRQVSGYCPYTRPSSGGGMSSYNRAAHPLVFQRSGMTPTVSSDGNKIGDSYADLVAGSLQEDLESMSGRNAFGDSQLPAAPLTDSLFHYVGDYNGSDGTNDAMLASPLSKTNIGVSNAGTTIF